MLSAEGNDAVLCFNGTMAIGALRACHEAGVRGPQDIAITGFDNTKEGAYSTPTITIIAPDLDTLVEDTLKIFTPHIGQSGLEQPGTGTLVPWHLVIRESTGGPSTQC